MNKKSKEIVKKLCFTLVVVISIISIIGCPNTVSSKANGTDNKKPNPTPPPEDPVGKAIEAMRITKKSEAVTNLRGLGFGMIGDKLCLSYGKVGDLKGTPKLLSEAKQDIENEIGTWNDYPTGDSYSSIKDGLEKRWIAAKETVDSESSGLVKWLKPTTIYNSYFPTGKVKWTYGIDIDINGLTFSVDVNEGKLFAVSNSAGGGYQLFADWEIVFVEKVEDPDPDKIPEIYSFHYGPYTLKGNFDKDNPKISDEYDNTKIVHVFTLAEMLKVYLKKTGKEAIADQVIEKFSPLLSENKGKYDVYLVFGKISRKRSSEPFAYYEFVYHSFRNVLKLTDDIFWDECWNP